MTELWKLSAEELALGIRLRRWSAQETLDAHLARIRVRNPELNAIVLVDEDGADLNFEQVWETFGQVLWCEVGSSMPPEAEAAEAERLFGKRDDPISRGAAGCTGATMRQFTAAMTTRDRLIAILERFFDNYDVWLCPVTVGPAIRHCEPGTPVPVDDGSVTYWMGGLAYTTPFNLIGNPVVVLPLGRSPEGLPLGVQVVARRWDDMRALAVAEAIDSGMPAISLA